VPDFESGAMENYGLIMYRESSLLISNENLALKKEISLIISHELAHQWVK
jgi:aminopeptidase N